MRDNKGRFASGNKFGKGRPVGSGKKHVKEMTWSALERVVRLLFTVPDKELIDWVKANGDELSRAEKIFLDTKNAKKLEHLNSLLDRIIGKPTYAQDSIDEQDDELEEALAYLEELESGEAQGDSEDKSKNEAAQKLSENEFIQNRTEKQNRSINNKKKARTKRKGKRRVKNHAKRKK